MKIIHAAIAAGTCVLALSTGAVKAQTFSVDNAFDWGFSHSSFPPAKAVDGNLDSSSRWAANHSTEAVNLVVDLGSVQTLDDIGIAWAAGDNRSYVFEVWARPGTSGTWTKIFDDQSSGTTTDIEQYNVTDIAAREVRVKTFSNSAGTDWANIIEFEVYGTAGPSGDNGGDTHSVPGLIEAEDFSDYNDSDSANRGGAYRPSEGVDIQGCDDSGCGFNIGWTSTGEWLEYEIDVDSSGDYEAQVRVASTQSSGQLSFDVDGSQAGNTLTVNNTGDWQIYTTQTVDLGFLSSGNHTLRLNVENSSFNLNWINIVSSSGPTNPGAISVPGRIEAEDFTNYADSNSSNQGGEYRTDEGVDIQGCNDSGCGYNVGWTANGEWLEYEINVNGSDNYVADVRLASPVSSGSFAILIDGSNVTGTVSVDDTGDWQTYYTETVDLGNISSGSHTLRLNVVSGSFNINWIEVEQGDGDDPGEPGEFGLDPSADPWDNFDLSEWALDTPAPRDDDACRAERTWDYEWDDSNPLDSSSAPFFFTHSDGGMRFVTRIDGQTTSDDCNEGYVRSELREMLRAGDNDIDDTGVTENNWALGYQPNGGDWGGRNGVLSATLRVNKVTTSGDSSQIGRVIIGQIHASNDEPLRLYYRHRTGQSNGCIYFAHEIRGDDDEDFFMIGNESCTSGPSNGIALGELFSYTIENDDNEIEVIIRRGDFNGSIIASETINMDELDSGYDLSSEWMYFKAGAYTQNDSGNNSDGDIVTFYRLSKSHDSN